MSKTLPWFRLYTKTVDDEKLKLLAFEDRWHFVAILCLKGQGLLDKGDEPAMLFRKVAVKMGLDVRTLEEVARRLEEVELIDAATLQPLKWAGLQMRSDTDPTAKDRKTRQRVRDRAKAKSEVLGAPQTPGQDGAAPADSPSTPAAPVTPDSTAETRASAGSAGDHGEVTDASRVTGTDVTRTDTDIEGEGSSSSTTVAKGIEGGGGFDGQGFAQPVPDAAKKSNPAPKAEPMRVKAGNGTEYEIPAELHYPGEATKTHKAWIAYAIAYEQRYKTWPVWNATVAGQLSQFIDRAGAELAPRVAVHYVRRVEDPFVLRQMHAVKLLLQDAEKWVTQFKTGAATPTAQAPAAQNKHAGAAKAIYQGLDT